MDKSPKTHFGFGKWQGAERRRADVLKIAVLAPIPKAGALTASILLASAE